MRRFPGRYPVVTRSREVDPRHQGRVPPPAAMKIRAQTPPTRLLLLAGLFFFACGRPGSRDHAQIQNKGSDTLLDVAQAWAEAYGDMHERVYIAVTGGGSGTGISALINGTLDIANSSRRMRESEIEQARANGIEPLEHVVGYDAVAVFLNARNPIREMRISELRSIYAADGSTTKWSELGVEVPGCPSEEIVRVSRQNNSGTYIYFRDAVLGRGADYKLGSLDMHGSKDVVELVGHTPCAIGFSGLAYATPHVGMPCLAQEGGACVAPSVETAIDGTFPIARPLLMYTAGEPQGHVRDYLSWILSETGQCIVQARGYAPIAKDLACPSARS